MNSTPHLKWCKSNIHRGHTMVLYFKGKCTHFSPFSQLCPFAYDLCETQVLIGTTSREILNFQKILMPSKITLPLHRFIKKFLKIFQAHRNSIASPPRPTPVPQKSQANGRRSEYCLKGVLLLFKEKCVTRIFTIYSAMDSRYF